MVGNAGTATGTKRHATRARGLTLVEVLVVLGVLAVVAAIALPVLQRARTRGGQALYESDARSAAQLHAAWQNDHQLRFVNVGVHDEHFARTGRFAEPSFIVYLNSLEGTLLHIPYPQQAAHDAWPAVLEQWHGEKLRLKTRFEYGFGFFTDPMLWEAGSEPWTLWPAEQFFRFVKSTETAYPSSKVLLAHLHDEPDVGADTASESAATTALVDGSAMTAPSSEYLPQCGGYFSGSPSVVVVPGAYTIDGVRGAMSHDNRATKRRTVVLATLAIAALAVAIVWLALPRMRTPAEVAVPERAAVASPTERRAMPHAAALAASVERTVASSRELQAREQLGEVASETMVALASASWEPIEALFLSKGCAADPEVAAMMRVSYAARPAQFRPADLNTMSDAELVALRTKDNAKPLATIRPATVAAVAIAPRVPGQRAVVTERLGDAARLENIVHFGGSGGAMTSDFPFSSPAIARAEASGAAPAAAVLVEGRSASGATVLLVVEFLHAEEVGWVPRRVTSVTPDGDGALFTPRM